jgi:hypothetical protein
MLCTAIDNGSSNMMERRLITQRRRLIRCRLLMQLLPRWSANRCDLNPIEMVWAIMGARLGVAGSLFVRGSSPLCRSCGMHCPWIQSTRMCSISSLVLAVRGASIPQLLSSHMTEPRARDMWGGEIVPFTAEKDAYIMAWVRHHWRKWTRLLEEGQGQRTRTALSLKHRYFVLDDTERNEMLARLSELVVGYGGPCRHHNRPDA